MAVPADADTLISAQVAELDRDRWLASASVTEPARTHILRLLAFSLEIATVRDHISEPMPGEIRLQWWRDVLAGAEADHLGDAARHPLVMPLLETIRRFSLPVPALTALVDARTFDLYDDPMPSLNDLEGYLGETASALFQLSAIIAHDGRDPGTSELSGHAGVAYGLTGVMRALRLTAGRGQCFLPLDELQRMGVSREDVVALRPTPGVLAVLDMLRTRARDHLVKARRLLKDAPEAVRPVYAGLALVEPNLKALETRAHEPFAADLGLSGWRRPLALWWGARGL